MAKAKTPARWRLGALLAALAVLPSGCGLLPSTGPQAGASAASTAVVVDGALGFRDLGGHATRQGSTTASGRIFRSSALDRLTDKGKAQLTGLGITTVIDFRGTDEAAARADHVPAGLTVMVLPANGGRAVGPPVFSGKPEPKPETLREFRAYVA